MIHCTVLRDPSGPWYVLGGANLTNVFTELVIPPFLYCPYPPEVEAEDDIVVGSAPIQGKRIVIGPKREKEVSHLSATGWLQSRSSGLVRSRNYEDGWYYETTGGVQHDCRAPIVNGLDVIMSKSADVGEATYNFVTYVMEGPYELTQSIEWTDDVFYVITTRVMPDTAIVFPPPTRSFPGSSSTFVTGYRWTGTSLIAKESGWISIADVPATKVTFLSALMTSTGTFTVSANSSIAREVYGTPGGILSDMLSACSNIPSMPEANLVLEAHPTDLGELTTECITQLDVVEDNLVTVMFDIIEWRTWFANLRSLGTQLPSIPKKVLGSLRRNPVFKLPLGEVPTKLPDIDFVRGQGKKAASMYLVWKYVVCTTAQDVSVALSGLFRHLEGVAKVHQRLHSRKVVQMENAYGMQVTHTAVLTVVTTAINDGFLGMLTQLIELRARYGLHPGLTQGWDVIPYSFVLDKVIQVGDFLEQCDGWLRAEYRFPVLFSICSEKWSVDLPSRVVIPECPGHSGSVAFRYYVRWINEGFAPSPPVDEIDTENRLWGNFTPQLVSLVAQKRL